MTFNVTGFKSNVAAEGFHRPSHFEVMIMAPVSGLSNARLRTNIASGPGTSFLSIDGHRPYSSGKTYNIPYAYNPQPIACTHLLDDNGEILSAFWEWTDLIADLRGDHKFSAGYFDDYKGQLLIRVFNNSGSQIKVITLNEVYPESVDQMQLSWESSDQITQLSVNYRFSSYELL